MPAGTDLKCFIGDRQRTGPDRVIHLPERPGLWEYAGRWQFVPGSRRGSPHMTVPES